MWDVMWKAEQQTTTTTELANVNVLFFIPHFAQVSTKLNFIRFHRFYFSKTSTEEANHNINFSVRMLPVSKPSYLNFFWLCKDIMTMKNALTSVVRHIMKTSYIFMGGNGSFFRCTQHIYRTLRLTGVEWTTQLYFKGFSPRSTVH